MIYTPDFDLESIPWTVLQSHYKSRIGRLSRGVLRTLSCGHKDHEAGCAPCERRKKRVAAYAPEAKETA